MPENMYVKAITNSTGFEKNQMPANSNPKMTINRNGWRARKSMSLKL